MTRSRIPLGLVVAVDVRRRPDRPIPGLGDGMLARPPASDKFNRIERPEILSGRGDTANSGRGVSALCRESSGCPRASGRAAPSCCTSRPTFERPATSWRRRSRAVRSARMRSGAQCREDVIDDAEAEASSPSPTAANS